MKKKSLIAVLKDYFSGQPEEEKKPEAFKPMQVLKPNTWGSSGRIAQMRNGTLMQQRIPTLGGNPLCSKKKV